MSNVLSRLIFTGALAACLGGCGSSASSDDVVTIGFTGPLSGGAALYGRNTLDGLEMAIADVNAAGGVSAGGRRVRVEMVSLDDRYFPNESATNAKRLVHQHSTGPGNRSSNKGGRP